MNNLMVPPESILSPPYNALSPHFADPNGFEELAGVSERAHGNKCYSKRRTCGRSEVCAKMSKHKFG